MLYAYIVKDRPLINAEEHLSGVDRIVLRVIFGKRGLAPGKPPVGALAGSLDILSRGGYLYALVKGHGNVGSEVRLYAHAILGSHKNMPPVHMRVEFYALLAYLAELCEGEYLKTAAVSEYGAVPRHESVEAAHLLDELIARSDVQVVCVRQLDLAADLLQVARGERALYCALRSDVHKYGSLDDTVRRLELASAGMSLLLQ